MCQLKKQIRGRQERKLKAETSSHLIFFFSLDLSVSAIKCDQHLLLFLYFTILNYDLDIDCVIFKNSRLLSIYTRYWFYEFKGRHVI